MMHLHFSRLDWAASSFAFGTHKFGGNGAPDADCDLTDAHCFALMDQYAALGGNILDTASIYGRCCHPHAPGYTEICVGEWLRRSGMRDKILLMTKGAHPHTHNGVKEHRVTAHDIADDLAQSFENLQTDRIDVYFLHRDDPRIPAGEILEWLNPYVQNGSVRVLGASNWTMARIAEANAYARAHGLAEFEVSEIGYSLRKEGLTWNDGTAVEMNPTEYAAYLQTQMPVFAYNAQASGFFYTNFSKPDAEIDDLPENIEKLHRIRTLCRESGLSPQEVVLGYLNAQPLCLVPIAATASLSRIPEIFAGASAKLTPEMCAFLDGTRAAP